MKRWRTGIVVCLLLAAGWISVTHYSLLTEPSVPEQNSRAGGAFNKTGAVPNQSNPGAPSSSTDEKSATALAARAGQRLDSPMPTNLPPDVVLENLHRAVHQYGVMFGGDPVGTNPEITAALEGNNPKKINFLNSQPGMKINGNGELVDSWGTPYFFHQLSGMDMEIHSAGPDKVMWTSDDLVTK